jgi:hypothetical protein
MNLNPPKEISLVDLIIAESLLPENLVLPYFEKFAINCNKQINELNREDIENIMIDLLQKTLLEAKRKYS